MADITVVINAISGARRKQRRKKCCLCMRCRIQMMQQSESPWMMKCCGNGQRPCQYSGELKRQDLWTLPSVRDVNSSEDCNRNMITDFSSRSTSSWGRVRVLPSPHPAYPHPIYLSHLLNISSYTLKRKRDIRSSNSSSRRSSYFLSSYFLLKFSNRGQYQRKGESAN